MGDGDGGPYVGLAGAGKLGGAGDGYPGCLGGRYGGAVVLLGC